MSSSNNQWSLIGKTAILLLFMMALGNTGAGAEVIEVKTGESVQNAINGANNGDTIIVSTGMYKENLIVNKKLTIKGKDGATIDGGSKGSVITVISEGNTVEGLTIQNSGSAQEDSGIFVKKGNGSVIKNNTLKNVYNGIYIANSKGNQVIGNRITSYKKHFSKRGNGIHLFKGGGHLLKRNEIDDVQDGIYFDFTNEIKVRENRVLQSRYAMHFMFSKGIIVEKNNVEKNITGFMVMDSSGINFTENRVADHFHVRGFGILLYESKDVQFEGNRILRNSTGLSLENGVNILTAKNVIAGNQVGLEFKGENQKNIFRENNFIGNVVQTKISTGDMRLDDGQLGNYWDDYSSFDLTGDGVGEEFYKAGSLYDRFLRKQPYWQFFFESPSIKLWSKAESLFPSFGSANVYDARPLVESVVKLEDSREEEGHEMSPAVWGALMMLGSLWMIVLGRKRK